VVGWLAVVWIFWRLLSRRVLFAQKVFSRRRGEV
jgi:hypothetical protein